MSERASERRDDGWRWSTAWYEELLTTLVADYNISIIISWVWEKRAHRWNNTQIFQVASQRKKSSTSVSWQTCSGVEEWRKSDETGGWITLNCFLSIYTSAFYLFLLFFGENSRWISSFSGVGPPKTALTEKPPNFFRSQGRSMAWTQPEHHHSVF